MLICLSVSVCLSVCLSVSLSLRPRARARARGCGCVYVCVCTCTGRPEKGQRRALCLTVKTVDVFILTGLVAMLRYIHLTQTSRVTKVKPILSLD